MRLVPIYVIYAINTYKYITCTYLKLAQASFDHDLSLVVIL